MREDDLDAVVPRGRLRHAEIELRRPQLVQQRAQTGEEHARTRGELGLLES